MAKEFWNTGWDPEQELLTCKHNIGELIRAYSAQQETITQLVQQNARLNDLLKMHRLEIEQLKAQYVKSQ